ncbi:MAG: hypothetical protein ABMB14_27530 [Myxococcota bacterium]
MNLGSKLYVVFGSVAMLLCWALALFGTPASTSEVAPVSVRENPASFRPVYSTWTGWHPMPAPSSGGGFGFGK